MSNRIQENENEHEDEIAAKINEELKRLTDKYGHVLMQNIPGLVLVSILAGVQLGFEQARQDYETGDDSFMED